MATEIPLDILIELYHLVAADWEPECFGKHPLVVFSAVCRYWRNAFTDMLPLWTKATFTPIDQFHPEPYLQKSSPLPCCVLMDLRVAPDLLQAGRHQVELQIQAIANHIHRLQGLGLYLNSLASLKPLLSGLAGLTASNLHSVYIHFPHRFEYNSSLSDFRSTFLEAPNLRHMASPGKCIYVFPTNLSSLTTLELWDAYLSLADYRMLFSSTRNLQTLYLEFRTPYVSRDLMYVHELHTFQILDLIEIPSLQYFSVTIPLLNDIRHCPCFLPVFHLPNLKVLDANLPYASPLSITPLGSLGHFHPLTVQAWNGPSSQLEKVRLRGAGWCWTPTVFTPSFIPNWLPRLDPFTKAVDLEWWCDRVQAPNDQVSKFMETRSTTVHYSGRWTDGDDQLTISEEVCGWLGGVLAMLDGPVTVYLPKLALASDVVTSFVECCGTRLTVVYSDKPRSIWDDIRERGGDVPELFKDERRITW